MFPRARTEKNEGSRKKEFEGGLVRERETESSRVFSLISSKKQMRREQREKRKTRRKTWENPRVEIYIKKSKPTRPIRDTSSTTSLRLARRARAAGLDLQRNGFRLPRSRQAFA